MADNRESARSILEEIVDQVSNVAGVERSRVAIIGGAVRDLLRGEDPRDVDAFVLGAERSDLSRRIREHTGRTLDRYNRHPLLAGELPGRIEIIAAEGYETTAELVDRADWNVSRFGFDGIFYGEENLASMRSGRSLELRLPLHERQNPLSTMRRGFLFADRFDLRFESSDVIYLANLIASREFPRSRVARRRVSRC